MRIVLIGRGRLATNLEPALRRAGHNVVSIDSRTLEGLPLVADVFVVSVKDAALEEVVSKATKGREQQLFVHTAGSMPMNLFENLTSQYGVFYPMQTFSKERRVDFSEISVFLEASSGTALQSLHQLAESLDSHVYHLSSDDRKQLHLAAVFACNFANHCYALSADILAQKGLPFSVMLPLVDETALKVHTMAPKDAQTGPAVRYDENIISMQLQMLSDTPLTKEIYERMSLSIHQKTKQSHD